MTYEETIAMIATPIYVDHKVFNNSTYRDFANKEEMMTSAIREAKEFWHLILSVAKDS